jgi:hypothetical protein
MPERAPLPRAARYAVVAVPLIMASLDLIENICIAIMLWTWPDLSHAVVQVSSTAVKIATGALTELLMAALAAGWVIRTWLIRRGGKLRA